MVQHKRNRSETMMLAGYYLARCGDRLNSSPPAALKVNTWNDAYDLFFEVAGDGRSHEGFRSSMARVRGPYGKMFRNGRTTIPKLMEFHRNWESRTDEELESEIFKLLRQGNLSDPEPEQNSETGRSESIKADKLLELFENLNIWKANGQRAPHKPLLVLWAIGRCLRGEERMVPYAELRPELINLLRQFAPPRKAIYPEDPFWRLRADGVWEIPGADRISLRPNKGARDRSLLENNAYGGFPKEVYDTLRADENLATRIVSRLLDSHFPSTLHERVLQAVNLDTEFEYVRRRPRDREFSEKVLSAYGHQCAVCHFAVRLDKTSIGLEAAHIRWHCASGPDLIRNALSLCALHHRLFDVGAFTLSSGHRILVSNLVSGNGADKTLDSFRSKEIILPRKDEFIPEASFLNWHHKNVFRGDIR